MFSNLAFALLALIVTSLPLTSHAYYLDHTTVEANIKKNQYNIEVTESKNYIFVKHLSSSVTHLNLDHDLQVSLDIAAHVGFYYVIKHFVNLTHEEAMEATFALSSNEVYHLIKAYKIIDSEIAGHSNVSLYEIAFVKKGVLSYILQHFDTAHKHDKVKKAKVVVIVKTPSEETWDKVRHQLKKTKIKFVITKVTNGTFYLELHPDGLTYNKLLERLKKNDLDIKKSSNRLYLYSV